MFIFQDMNPVHIYTQEEIERILDRFKDLPYIYYSFLTTYYTGLRVPEVYRLTWDNIDFENKTLTVDKNIIRKNKDRLFKRYNIAKGHSTIMTTYNIYVRITDKMGTDTVDSFLENIA